MKKYLSTHLCGVQNYSQGQKLKTMKHFLLFLTTITLICSCNKNDESAYANYYEGKWKLMRIDLTGDLYLIDFLDPPTVDYSGTNINYEFKKDGNITVSGEVSHLDLDWYAENGFLDLFLAYEIGLGVYPYSVKFLADNGWCAWDLKIEDDNCRLIVEENKSQMTITKTIAYSDLPLISTRTSPAPYVLYVFTLEKCISEP